MAVLAGLQTATLVRRYKRFLADVELETGETVVVHCPNPGTMIGCAEPGSRVLLRHSADPKRKLPFTWVMTISGGTYISVDTLLANKAVHEALAAGTIPELRGYEQIRPEFSFGDSRFDFLLSGSGGDCLVEVKSTTLCENGVAMFPDAKTERGRKHLQGLMAAKAAGFRAVQFFCVSRDDAQSFTPAAHIDPKYADVLRSAAAAGVEVTAWLLQVSERDGVHHATLIRSIPVSLS